MVETMTNVEVDHLGTKVLWSTAGTAPLVEGNSLTWPEDRWLIGWSPWIGYGKGAVLESHYMLKHGGDSLFVKGPHKEDPSVAYDHAHSEFFPAGHGRFVKAGETVSTEFLVSSTGPSEAAGQANCRVFSVKA